MIDADEVLAFVCTATGWTWDYTHAHLDIPRLLALNRVWRRHPPAHVAIHQVLMALGAVKPEPGTPSANTPKSENNLTELASLVPLVRPEGIDSRSMSESERQRTAERLLYGQEIRR